MARSETAIFSELTALCVLPGYAHAVAHFCFRDNMVLYAEEMTAEDMQRMYSMERLSRTEISTLIGLMVKQPIDYSLPNPEIMQQYIDQTDELLKELHQFIAAHGWQVQDWKKIAAEGGNPFQKGEAMREPIFYSGEGAYDFQYRDFSILKYGCDDNWLLDNRGFSIGAAREVVQSIIKLHSKKLFACFDTLRNTPSNQLTLLPGHKFTSKEVADSSGVQQSVVERILASFSLPQGEVNNQFKALSDFNVTNALPLICVSTNEYLLFQGYSLVEALYESPFYWMSADKSYVATAMKNRGKFTEEFARERLETVFGKGHVYANVNLTESKSKTVGEIDVLVVFADRAIVLQAKSKKLTLEARKGNDLQIKSDFKQSVQDSYDQGYLCAAKLNDPRYKLFDASSQEIAIARSFKEIYIFCVVSDHYPALSFQTRQFLKYEKSDIIRPPFVMDVFTLDAITEMLQSPLHLLSYASRRALYADRLVSTQELTILSYHLNGNLWLDDQHDMVFLGEDISADLDIAMASRRDGVPGKATPDGILTKYKDTILGNLIREIEMKADPGTIGLGFMLLTLSEVTIKETNDAIKKLASKGIQDRKNHDVTIAVGEGNTGFTIHINDSPLAVAGPSLRAHCERRKYTQRASSWFGICLSPSDTRLRFGLSIELQWTKDAALDAATEGLSRGSTMADAMSALKQRHRVGRNDLCPCGSGRKYKKCCLQ
jgi:SEC-C motif/Nuclease-related domain